MCTTGENDTENKFNCNLCKLSRTRTLPQYHTPMKMLKVRLRLLMSLYPISFQIRIHIWIYQLHCRKVSDHALNTLFTITYLMRSSPKYKAIVFKLDHVLILNSTHEDLQIPEWKVTTKEDIRALETNGTWAITTNSTSRWQCGKVQGLVVNIGRYQSLVGETTKAQITKKLIDLDRKQCKINRIWYQHIWFNSGQS